MKIPILLIITICQILSGCSMTTIQLRNLNQDIPSSLVEKYNSSDESYVDKGQCFCLPLLLFGDEYVTKTHSGFEVYHTSNLGFILLDGTKSSQYDNQGRLLYYRHNGNLLAPLIYSNSATKEKCGEIVKNGHSWRFLSFGYEEKVSGQKYLSALWIPIPLNKVDSEEETNQNQKFEPTVKTPAE